MKRTVNDFKKLRAMGAKISAAAHVTGLCKKCGQRLDRPGIKYHEQCRPHKYRNVKQAGTFLGTDVLWDSKKECLRGDVLLMRLAAGLICDLARQVPYALKVNGVIVATYHADFVYRDNENGCVVIEDVKSEPTRCSSYYQLKKRLFAACFPHLSITEV